MTVSELNMPEQDKSIKLLLIDDEEEFLSSATTALTRRGMEIETAQHGIEGLKILAEKTIDVVVLDQKMPGMDGLEVLGHIREKFPDLPVIILTGHGSIPQAFYASRKGIFDYLSKPCDIEKLTEKIQEAFHQSSSAESIIAPAKEKSYSKLRVLLVDDEAELLESLSNVLSRRKMAVRTANSGEEALNILQDELIEVVVLDIKMPGMDGIETLKRIKRNHPAIEVILLTGHPDVNNALQGVKLGAFDYMVKPPEIEELTDTIRKAELHRLELLEQQRQNTVRDILSKHPD